MKKLHLFLVFSTFLMLSSCTSDQNVLNKVIGEYEGIYIKNNTEVLDYHVAVSGDLNALTFTAPDDTDFIEFSGEPEIIDRNLVNVSFISQDSLTSSSNFDIDQDETNLFIVLINEETNDTIMYTGLRE